MQSKPMQRSAKFLTPCGAFLENTKNLWWSKKTVQYRKFVAAELPAFNLVHERLKIQLQHLAVIFREIGKSKGLQPAARSPHGKKHFRLNPHRGRNQMKSQFHHQLFSQRTLQIQHSAADGKNVQPGADVLAIRQTHQSQNRSAQSNSRSALLFC